MATHSDFSKLHSLYRDKDSDIFLTPNTAKLYAAAKKEAALSHLTYEDIETFKTQVETIARTKAEKRLKPGTKRYSYRPYKFFGRNIIAGDLAFIPRISKADPSSTDKNKRPGILAIFMCCHSRLISLNFQPNAKAETTLTSFQKSLNEDFKNHKFTHFLSDRGNEFKSQFVLALKEKHGITPYVVSVSNYPKASIIGNYTFFSGTLSLGP